MIEGAKIAQASKNPNINPTPCATSSSREIGEAKYIKIIIIEKIETIKPIIENTLNNFNYYLVISCRFNLYTINIVFGCYFSIRAVQYRQWQRYT